MSEDAAEYDSLRSYMEGEKSDLLAQIQSNEGRIEKYPHTQQARNVSSILTKTEELNQVRTVREGEQWLANRGKSVEDVDVVIHMGCHAVQSPIVMDSTMDVIEAFGHVVLPLGGFNNCCGVLDIQNGDLDTAEKVDDVRFDNIEAFEPEYALTECTSCFAQTNELSLGYRDTPGYEFMSMIEFLYHRREELGNLAEVTDPVTITLHDHYDAFGWTPPVEAHYAREVFRALPGVDIVEMEHKREDALPCDFYADPSEYGVENLTIEVFKEAAQTGADVMINFMHACHRRIAEYDPYFPIDTKNYTSFIGERLGFTYREKIKEYKIAARNGKIDWIIEDARPVFQANSLDESQAREIIETYLATDPLPIAK